jgi:hypothetical protein
MAWVLGPLLLQVVSLVAGDRSELRERIYGDQRILETESRPFATLNLREPTDSLRITYSPDLLVTPVDIEKDRQLYVFHTASIAATKRFKRTTVTLSEGLGYGIQVYAITALGAPLLITPTSTGTTGATTGSTGTGATGAGTTGTGTTGTPTGTGAPPGGTGTTGANVPGGQAPNPAQLGAAYHYASSRTELSVLEALSPRTSVNVVGAYGIAGGVGSNAAEDAYPVIQGPDGRIVYFYLLSPSNTLTSSFRAQYLFGPADPSYLFIGADVGFIHRFSKHFALGGAIGLGFTRTVDLAGYTTYTLEPTFGSATGAVFEYSAEVAHGTLTLRAGAGYAPMLDTLSDAADPRLSLIVGTGYVRDRFSVQLYGSSILSTNRQNEGGALSALGAGAIFAYNLGRGFRVDTGARAAWATLGEITNPTTNTSVAVTVIPPSYAVFVGLGWAGTLIGK